MKPQICLDLARVANYGRVFGCKWQRVETCVLGALMQLGQCFSALKSCICCSDRVNMLSVYGIQYSVTIVS